MPTWPSLKPDATNFANLVSGAAATLEGGAPSPHEALANLGAWSFIARLWKVQLQTFALPAGARTKYIQFKVDAQQVDLPSGGFTHVWSFITLGTGSTPLWSMGIQHAAGGVDTTETFDVTLTQADIDALYMECTYTDNYSPELGSGGTSGKNARFYDAYYSVTYALQPSTTIQAPSGNIVSPTPTVSFTHTPGADGGAQTAYQYKIFTAAQYGIGGFDPDTSPSSFSGSGTTATSFTSPSLTNNTTYRVYIRTAQTVNGAAHYAPWAFSQFTVSQKPSTSNWAPIGIHPWPGGSKTFTWSYSHPNPAKTQTAYRLIVRRAADDSVYFDTTKTASTSHQHVRLSWEAISGPTQYYWTLQVWDTDDIPGDVSAPQFITFIADPLVIVSSPTPNQVFTVPFSVQWAIDTGIVPLSQTNQAAYRVIFYDGPSVMTDTDWLSGQNASYVPPSYSVFQVGHPLRVEVRLRDTNTFEGTSGLIPFTVAWPLPAPAGSVSVDVSQVDIAAGAVVVSFDSDVADPDFLEWRIYRRIVPDGPWTLAGIDTRASQGVISFQDYSFLSNVEQEWAVVQAITDFGQVLESAYSATDTDTPLSAYYWLVDSVDPNYAVCLFQTVSDSFNPEYERFEGHIIGRGRRVEIGDYLGIRGSLTVHYHDTAGAVSLDLRTLEVLQLRKTPVWVRTPFGRTVLCYLADLSINRLAGVGAREMVDVTIPYVEIG